MNLGIHRVTSGFSELEPHLIVCGQGLLSVALEDLAKATRTPANRKIAARSFAGWMAHFDEPGLGDFQTLTQLIDRMRVKVPERKLRNQIDCFERRFAVAALAPVASPWTLATSYEPGLTLDRSH